MQESKTQNIPLFPQLKGQIFIQEMVQVKNMNKTYYLRISLSKDKSYLSVQLRRDDFQLFSKDFSLQELQLNSQVCRSFAKNLQAGYSIIQKSMNPQTIQIEEQGQVVKFKHQVFGHFTQTSLKIRKNSTQEFSAQSQVFKLKGCISLMKKQSERLKEQIKNQKDKKNLQIENQKKIFEEKISNHQDDIKNLKKQLQSQKQLIKSQNEKLDKLIQQVQKQNRNVDYINKSYQVIQQNQKVFDAIRSEYINQMEYLKEQRLIILKNIKEIQYIAPFVNTLKVPFEVNTEINGFEQNFILIKKQESLTVQRKKNPNGWIKSPPNHEIIVSKNYLPKNGKYYFQIYLEILKKDLSIGIIQQKSKTAKELKKASGYTIFHNTYIKTQQQQEFAYAGNMKEGTRVIFLIDFEKNEMMWFYNYVFQAVTPIKQDLLQDNIYPFICLHEIQDKQSIKKIKRQKSKIKK